MKLIVVLTDRCRFPKSNAQYRALSSDRLSLPVEAERTLAPVRPWGDIIKFALTFRLGSDNLGAQGGFLDTLPVGKSFVNDFKVVSGVIRRFYLLQKCCCRLWLC